MKPKLMCVLCVAAMICLVALSILACTGLELLGVPVALGRLCVGLACLPVGVALMLAALGCANELVD